MTRLRRLNDTFDTGLVCFRRDLRSTDNAALYYALKHCVPVWCAFVFDTTILQPLSDAGHTRHPDTQPQDRRVEFILAALGELDEALRAKGGGLIVLYGDPVDLVPRLADELSVDAVFTNHDYEPVAIGRDETVHERLAEAGRQWLIFKDQVIFERDEVLTGQNKPFTVFTP